MLWCWCSLTMLVLDQVVVVLDHTSVDGVRRCRIVEVYEDAKRWKMEDGIVQLSKRTISCIILYMMSSRTA